MNPTSNMKPENIKASELYLPVDDLKTEMPFFLNELGFRLEEIFPADDPAVAVISGHGVRIRLDRDADVQPGRLRLRYNGVEDLADGMTKLTSQRKHY